MKKHSLNFQLSIFLFLLSIFIASGCTKKVTKVDMAGHSVTQDEVIKEAVTEEKLTSEELIEEEAVEDKEASTEAISEEIPEIEEPIAETIGELPAIERKFDVAQEVGGLLPVFFDYDRYVLRKDTRGILQRNADRLRNKSMIKVSIEGHADERGSNEYNLALGDRRARSVKMYLSDLGVTVELSTVTFGEEKPVCRESFEECWSKNRRVEFVIAEPD